MTLPVSQCALQLKVNTLCFAASCCVQVHMAVTLAILLAAAVGHAAAAAATSAEPLTAFTHTQPIIPAAGGLRKLAAHAISTVPDSLAAAATALPTAAATTAARRLQAADKIDISQCSRISEGARVCGRGLVYSCCGGSECFSIRSAEEAAQASGNGGYSGVCDLSVQRFACCKI